MHTLIKLKGMHGYNKAKGLKEDEIISGSLALGPRWWGSGNTFRRGSIPDRVSEVSALARILVGLKPLAGWSPKCWPCFGFHVKLLFSEVSLRYFFCIACSWGVHAPISAPTIHGGEGGA